MSLPIPDLRFEQSFISQLNKYAGNKQPDQQKLQPLSSKKYNHIATLTDDDLKLMNEELDIEEEEEIDNYTDKPQPKPLAPITPSIVIYAIIKDQMLMPLLQGFLWTGVLLCVRPLLKLVVRNGQYAGHWVSNLLGLNRLATSRSSLHSRRSFSYKVYQINTNLLSFTSLLYLLGNLKWNLSYYRHVETRTINNIDHVAG